MTRFRLLFAVAAAFVLVPLVASAACGGDVCTQVYVQMIYVETGTNNTWIQTTGTETDLSICTPDSGTFLQLDGAQTQAKSVLALLMMAYSMDKLVTLRIYNGSRGCAISYALVERS